MFLKLAILFTVVPIVELYFLIKAGTFLGIDVTVGMVLLTGIVGAALAKKQGFKVLGEIRQCMEKGMVPGKEILEGILVLTGGLTLLTPGFVTDLLGFSLLIPVSRKFYSSLILGYFKGKFTQVDNSYIDVEKIEERD